MLTPNQPPSRRREIIYKGGDAKGSQHPTPANYTSMGFCEPTLVEGLTLNPKSEYLNPKQILNSNAPILQTMFGILVISASNLFRILIFRASDIQPARGSNPTLKCGRKQVLNLLTQFLNNLFNQLPFTTKGGDAV